jgi:hypothetical protein
MQTNENFAVSQVTYDDLVERFGKDSAKNLVRCIEKLAAINDNIICFDEEERFAKAFHALVATNFA